MLAITDALMAITTGRVHRLHAIIKQLQQHNLDLCTHENKGQQTLYAPQLRRDTYVSFQVREMSIQLPFRSEPKAEIRTSVELAFDGTLSLFPVFKDDENITGESAIGFQIPIDVVSEVCANSSANDGGVGRSAFWHVIYKRCKSVSCDDSPHISLGHVDGQTLNLYDTAIQTIGRRFFYMAIRYVPTIVLARHTTQFNSPSRTREYSAMSLRSTSIYREPMLWRFFESARRNPLSVDTNTNPSPR